MEEGGQHHHHRGAGLRRRAVGQGNAGEEEMEIAVGELGGDGGVRQETEREGAREIESNSCCICHEPWASSGRHRICCIPCGHLYGRSCLELWLARSGGAAAKCVWCGKAFRRRDMVNLYGATEHLLLDQVQVATEEEEEEEQDEAADSDGDEQQQEEARQEQEGRLPAAAAAAAAMDGIARMNMNNMNQQGHRRHGAVAWKGLEVAWTIDSTAAAAAAAPPDNDTNSSGAILLLGAILLVLFLGCAVLCFTTL